MNDRDQQWAEGVRAWWTKLRDDRGGTAALRRCRTAGEVFFCRAFHDLLRRVKDTGFSNREVMAVIAGVLSHIRNDRPDLAFVAQMAEDKGGRARVSELRFRRLLEQEKRDALFVPLQRVIHLMDRTVNVESLANAIRYWGPKVKMEWACDYYERAPRKEKK